MGRVDHSRARDCARGPRGGRRGGEQREQSKKHLPNGRRGQSRFNYAKFPPRAFPPLLPGRGPGGNKSPRHVRPVYPVTSAPDGVTRHIARRRNARHASDLFVHLAKCALGAELLRVSFSYDGSVRRAAAATPPPPSWGAACKVHFLAAIEESDEQARLTVTASRRRLRKRKEPAAVGSGSTTVAGRRAPS